MLATASICHSPLTLLATWLRGAAAQTDSHNHDAMSLATVDPDGRPSNRIVLCKRVDEEAGGLVFFTNYESRKARALAINPYAAATFHWDALGRQARVEGLVQRVSAAESDAYFNARPIGARIGAWASRQSEPLASRDELERAVEKSSQRAEGDLVPRPPFWGGYLLLADRVELWVAGDNRLHERVLWSRSLGVDSSGAHPTSAWQSTLLYP